VVELIEKWIDQTIMNYSNQMRPCSCFTNQLKGYYSEEFLSECSYVVLDKVPMPEVPELHQKGLAKFIDMEPTGITYKNVYFVKKGFENELAIHFHELIHVLQWRYLGAKEFIARYLMELQQHGYEKAPLEIMAYSLENDFRNNKKKINIQHYVKMQYNHQVPQDHKPFS
jgi:hypothetical protein